MCGKSVLPERQSGVDAGSNQAADFPGGDTRKHYRSTKKLLALPPATRLFIALRLQSAGT
jgi:hypothetical protein